MPLKSPSKSPSKTPPSSPRKSPAKAATGGSSPAAQPALKAKAKPGRAPAKAKRDTLIGEDEWVTMDQIGSLLYETKSGVRDTTAVAQHLHQDTPTPLEHQYLSQPVTVARPVPGGSFKWLPALALRGVRVQYKKAHSKYGRHFVQMAIPTSAVQAIVDQLTRRGVTFGPELVQEETVRFLDGEEFTTFRTDVKKVPFTWSRDGLSRSIVLANELIAVKRDLISSVVFNLALKYKGPQVADVTKAPMALKFEAAQIIVNEAAKEAIDPEKAVANESWGEKVDRLGLPEEWFEGDFGDYCCG